MPIQTDSLNRKLYDLLNSRGYNPIPRDSDVNNAGKTVAPEEADVFKFTFKQDNKEIDDVWVTIDGAEKLTVYYDQSIASKAQSKTPGAEIDDSWYGLLKFLKKWSLNKQLSFALEPKEKIDSDMAQRTYMKKKEQIAEGYYPMGKSASYNDNIPTVKIILQHTRQIQEGEQRYRNVAKIFLENTQGERILAPTVKPGIAQIYARHLAEGGVPNDERWNHIKSLCEEYTKMAGFVRAVRGNQFNESAQRLVEAGLNHYTSLRESLGRMRGHRGYTAYFESWTPTLMENEGDESTLNELFVQETLDPRIESVMPILNKLSKNLGEMKEVKELEEWAEGLLEAPGAETLAHNQQTELKRMKALDMDESEDAEAAHKKSQVPAFMRKQSGNPDWKTTTQDLEKAKERNISGKEGLAALAKRLDQIDEEEVEESGLQAYLGNKKYGKDGMDALRKAGRDGASKEKMASIRDRYNKLDEEGVAEGSLNEGQYEMMMRNGQVKKFIAKDDADAKRIAAGHGAKSVIRLKGGVPAGKISEQGVAEGWKEESQDLEDWSKEVNMRLYRAHETQRPGLARQLSKIEQKNFGSSLNQGSLTEIVKAALMALQKGQMVHYDPQRVGQMPFGNIIGDDAKIIAQYNITRDELAGYRMLHDKGMVDNLEQFLKLRRLVRAKSWPLEYYQELEKLSTEEAWLKMANDLNWSKDSMNEEVQAKTDDKLLAYYAQRKAEKEKQKQQGVAEGLNEFAPSPGFGGDDDDKYTPADFGKPFKANYLGQNKFEVFCRKPKDPSNVIKLNAEVQKYGLEWEDDFGFWFLDSPGAVYLSWKYGEIPLPKAIDQARNPGHIHDLVVDYLTNSPHAAEIQKIATEYFGFTADGEMNEGVAEDLDANQKRVGQLGPTEKVGPKGAVGKLVGANESVEINEMDKSQPSSDRGGESSGNPYAKGGKATPAKAKDAEKDAEKVLNKSMDKAHKKDVKEGQEDLDAILRIIRK